MVKHVYIIIDFFLMFFIKFYYRLIIFYFLWFFILYFKIHLLWMEKIWRSILLLNWIFNVSYIVKVPMHFRLGVLFIPPFHFWILLLGFCQRNFMLKLCSLIRNFQIWKWSVLFDDFVFRLTLFLSCSSLDNFLLFG